MGFMIEFETEKFTVTEIKNWEGRRVLWVEKQDGEGTECEIEVFEEAIQSLFDKIM